MENENRYVDYFGIGFQDGYNGNDAKIYCMNQKQYDFGYEAGELSRFEENGVN